MALRSVLRAHGSIKRFNIAHDNRLKSVSWDISALRLLFNNGRYSVVKITDMIPE